MVCFNGILDFQWYFRLARGSLDERRQINRRKGIVSRFKGKLVKMIKNNNGRFDDYSISPQIRKLSLHQSYGLIKNDLL